jgi:outer membrane protein
MRFMRPAFAAVLALFPAGIAHSQSAADVPAERRMMTSDLAAADWIVTLKATGNVSSTYLGADTSTFIAYPVPAFRRGGTEEGFSAADDGFDWSLLGNQYFSVGPVGRYRGGRYNGDDRDLRGLKSIPWTVELGAYGEVWPTDWLRGRLEVRHGLGSNYGFVGDLAIDLVARVDKWTLSAGPRMELGDGDFMDKYFGISAKEAARNGRVRRYDPGGGGIVSVGALVGAGYQWDSNWTLAGYVQYDRLVDKAADSPIVKKIGSPNQYVVGATISYSFGVNP